MRRFVLAAVLLCLALPASPAAAQPAAASAVLEASLQAMGGRERLLAIRTVSDTFVGTREMVEQSERPTGPYFVDHFRAAESLGLDPVRVRTRSDDWGYAGPQWWLTQTQGYAGDVLVDGGVDLVAPGEVAPDGTIRSWFTPQYLDEAISTVKREALDPQTIWGMHYGPVSYAAIVAARNTFLRGASP